MPVIAVYKVTIPWAHRGVWRDSGGAIADGSGVGLLLFSFACSLGAKLPRLCKSHDRRREGGLGQDAASRVQQPSPPCLSGRGEFRDSQSWVSAGVCVCIWGKTWARL